MHAAKSENRSYACRTWPSSSPQFEFLKDGGELRQRRRFLLVVFLLLAMREQHRKLPELLRRFRLGGELLDHLAVVGSQAEGLAVELDDLRRHEVERRREFLGGDLGP